MNVFSHAYLPFVSHLWWQNIWDLTCLEVKQLLYCLLDLEHLEDRDKFLVQLCILSGKLFVLWALVSLLSRWVYAAKKELSFQKEHCIHFIGTPKLFIFIYVCLFVCFESVLFARLWGNSSEQARWALPSWSLYANGGDKAEDSNCPCHLMIHLSC